MLSRRLLLPILFCGLIALVLLAVFQSLDVIGASGGYQKTGHIPHRTPPLQRKAFVAHKHVKKVFRALDAATESRERPAFIRPLDELPTPKILGSFWLDTLDYQLEHWEKTLRDARNDGYNGLYAVVGHDAASHFTPEQLADILLAFLKMCAEHGMECHLSFGALEETNEIEHTPLTRLARSIFWNSMQAMWDKGVNAQSPMIEMVVRTCVNSPYKDYLKSITIMQEPQFLSHTVTKKKYEEAAMAIARRVWEIDHDLTVVVKVESPSDQGALSHVTQLLPQVEDERILRSTHFCASSKAREWGREDIDYALSHVPAGTFIGMLHFNNEQGSAREKVFFLTNALESAALRKMDVAVFGISESDGEYDDHLYEKHAVYEKDRPAVAAKIKELRSKGLVQPQLSPIRLRSTAV